MTQHDSTSILASLDNSVSSFSNSFYTDSSNTLPSNDYLGDEVFGNALMSDRDLHEFRLMAEARGGSRPTPRPSRPPPPRHVPSPRPAPRTNTPQRPRHVPSPRPPPSSRNTPNTPHSHTHHSPSTTPTPHIPSSGRPKSGSTRSQNNGHIVSPSINKLGLLMVLTSAILIMQ